MGSGIWADFFNRFVAWLLALLLPFLGGCWIPLRGAGSAGIGYSSDARVYLFSEADGDKMKATSDARLVVDPALWSLLGLGTQVVPTGDDGSTGDENDEPDETTENPATGG